MSGDKSAGPDLKTRQRAGARGAGRRLTVPDVVAGAVLGFGSLGHAAQRLTIGR